MVAFLFLISSQTGTCRCWMSLARNYAVVFAKSRLHSVTWLCQRFTSANFFSLTAFFQPDNVSHKALSNG
jgi:hypothetical protein